MQIHTFSLPAGFDDPRPPTRVLLLNNMVGAGDVDEDISSVPWATEGDIIKVNCLGCLVDSLGFSMFFPPGPGRRNSRGGQQVWKVEEVGSLNDHQLVLIVNADD